ncbi:MAG: orotidine 5'-phosphate decarboxylase [Candidatus Aenigmarchaeota archaeon]|nr:orotidine 5'-phosphate decarboxylase [Candidatus Aenigmarchaeota archaeon]
MFLEKYKSAVREKRSIININLDPALPSQRKSHVIPERYVSKDDSETLLNFSLDIIEQAGDYCCSVKPNTQYFLPDTRLLRKIAGKIHEKGMIAILDHKLSDIGPTNDSAIHWISDMGFDAFTFSPFAGNMQNAVESAHSKNLGVIVLTLMSNPEAELFMVNSSINGVPSYQYIASEIRRTDADGCVVGMTGFVREEHIKNAQRLAGEKVFLMQGIGPQGGKLDLSKIKLVRNPLVSLGREVIFSENITQSVKRYYDLLGKVKKV